MPVAQGAGSGPGGHLEEAAALRERNFGEEVESGEGSGAERGLEGREGRAWWWHSGAQEA